MDPVFVKAVDTLARAKLNSIERRIRSARRTHPSRTRRE
jgi:hypothetical protein